MRMIVVPLLGGLTLRQLPGQQLLPDLVLLLGAQRSLAPSVARGILWSGHASPRARLTARRDPSTPKEMA
jgi:hypothetical protein